jgi:hypothetical protein
MTAQNPPAQASSQVKIDRAWNIAFATLFANITELGLSAAIVAKAAGPYHDAAIWTLIVVGFRFLWFLWFSAFLAPRSTG